MMPDTSHRAAKRPLGLHIPGDFTELSGFDPEPLFRSHRPRLESLQISIDPAADQRCIRLHNLFVHSNYRGQGIGTRTMHAVIRYADSLELPIWLCVNASGATRQEQNANSERLARWYRTFDFTEPSGTARQNCGIRCYSLQALIRHPKQRFAVDSDMGF